MKRLHFLAFALLILPAISFARPSSPVAADAYVGLPPGARSLAMGYAVVGVGDDPSAIYFNPAGIALLQAENILGLSFEAARQSELDTDKIFSGERLKDTSATLITLCNSKGAISWRPLANYASSTTLAGGWENTEVRVSQITLTATQTDDKVTNGINLSYLYGRVAQTSLDNGMPFANIAEGNGFSLDYGVLYSLSSIFRIGVSANNLCAFMWWDDYETQQLPFKMRTGFAYQISKIVTFAYDYDKIYYRAPDDAVSQNHLGLEQNFGDMIKLRVGVYGTDMNDKNKTHYTAGLGYTKDNINLDLGGERYLLDGADVYRIVMGLSIPL